MELFDATNDTEYVYIDVRAELPGSLVDPTSYGVEIAVMLDDSKPSTGGDWHTASWVTDSTGARPKYVARLLIGPSSGNVTLTAGRQYTVYVKVAATPEIVAKRSGMIQAF